MKYGWSLTSSSAFPNELISPCVTKLVRDGLVFLPEETMTEPFCSSWWTVHILWYKPILGSALLSSWTKLQCAMEYDWSLIKSIFLMNQSQIGLQNCSVNDGMVYDGARLISDQFIFSEWPLITEIENTIHNEAQPISDQLHFLPKMKPGWSLTSFLFLIKWSHLVLQNWQARLSRARYKNAGIVCVCVCFSLDLRLGNVLDKNHWCHTKLCPKQCG